MDIIKLEKLINQAWDKRDTISPSSKGDEIDAIREILSGLDHGKYRVAAKENGQWHVHEWVKKAVVMSFRLRDCSLINDPLTPAYDKVPLKFDAWSTDGFQQAEVRVVPGAIVRHSAFIAPRVVLMPCFVNVGAFVDSGTMVDEGVHVGSCAQIGKNCHLSMNVGIGGVLEPLQAAPVIIEDNVFIGAGSSVTEGVMVEEGAVLGMNVMLSASTKIVNRETGEITYGKIPPYAVVVSGTLPGLDMPNGQPGPSLACAVIIKQVDEKTRSKTAINELLR